MNPIHFYLILLSNNQYESIQLSIGRLFGMIGKNKEIMTSLPPQIVHQILVTFMQILSNYMTTSSNIQQLILELLRMYAEYSFVRHELHELSIKKLLHELHDFHTTINNQPVEATSDPGNQTNVIIPNLIPTSATGVELNENNLEIIYLIKELKTLCHQSSWFSLTKLHL